jgi:hypothetical protein
MPARRSNDEVEQIAMSATLRVIGLMINQAGIILVSRRRLLPLCQLLRRSRLWLLPRQSGARSRWHLRLVILPVLSLRRQQVVLGHWSLNEQLLILI